MANPIRKYAIILNGDTEERHVGNVARALKVLKRERFETFVASTERPQHGADYYTTARAQDVARLIAQVRAKIDANDELVIYTTGHGEQVFGEGQLCLGNDCYGRAVTEPLDRLVYGRRTIIADQCYGGNWKGLFVDDPKTLFISAGSEAEQVCCQKFAPRFWGTDVPDRNRDGRISWQERFDHTIDQQTISSFPVFASSPGYEDTGRAAFPRSVGEIETGAQLAKALRGLRPGQYAIVTFSATWCGPCKDYRPLFDQFARDAKGVHLFLRTENEDLAAAYGTREYPTVMIIDHLGNRRTVANREALLEEISVSHLSIEQRRDLVMKQILGGNTKVAFTAAMALGTLGQQLSPKTIAATLTTLRGHFHDASPKKRGPAIMAYGALLDSLRNRDTLTSEPREREGGVSGQTGSRRVRQTGKASITLPVEGAMRAPVIAEARAAFDELAHDRSPFVAFPTLYTLGRLAPALTEQQSLIAMATLRYYLFSNPDIALSAFSGTPMEQLYTDLVSHLSSVQQVAAELRTLRALFTDTSNLDVASAMATAYGALIQYAAMDDAIAEENLLSELLEKALVVQTPIQVTAAALGHSVLVVKFVGGLFGRFASLYRRLLSDPRPELQRAGLTGCRQFGLLMISAGLRELVPRILQLLTAPNAHVRYAAISAFAAIATEDPYNDDYQQGMGILKRLTRDRDAGVRRQAKAALDLLLD